MALVRYNAILVPVMYLNVALPYELWSLWFVSFRFARSHFTKSSYLSALKSVLRSGHSSVELSNFMHKLISVAQAATFATFLDFAHSCLNRASRNSNVAETQTSHSWLASERSKQWYEEVLVRSAIKVMAD